MKSTIPAFLVALIFSSCSQITFAGTYSGGSGTEEDPYQIAAVGDFLELTNTPIDWNKAFILMNDIDLTGLTFDRSPIAPDLSTTEINFQGTVFSGIFDGSGYVIHNLTVGASGERIDYAALFGYISSGGQIKNLGMEAINIIGNSFVGGLVGMSYAHITNCYSSGKVGGYNWIGGLVGHNPGLISDCYSDCLVSGTERLGGLVGSGHGIVSNSICLGNVKGITYFIGGIIGYNNGTIMNCYATCNVSGMSRVGGLAGYQAVAVIRNSFSTGTVIGEYYVGGLVGRNQSPIEYCYSSSQVTGKDRIGGLVGLNDGDGTITSCYSVGLVSGVNDVGGLVGYNESNSVTVSFWDTVTSGQNSSAGGTGKTTAEMKTLLTFIDEGWDFINETQNGTSDIWAMPNEGYPILSWQRWAKIITPNGGERYLKGKNVSIVYTSSGADLIPTVDIEYSTDGGLTWNPIEMGVLNTGTYEWTTPDIDSDNCIVRISSTDDPTINDTSDNTFIIFRCSEQIPADINQDCYVNLEDLAMLAQKWLWCGDRYNPDCGI